MNLTGIPPRQKLPKPIRDRRHLAFVAGLWCLCCGRQPCQAHHVRIGAYQLGKRQCDSRVVPLCPTCHSNLHSMNESQFWGDWDINPDDIAAWLYAVSGDCDKGKMIMLRPEGKVT